MHELSIALSILEVAEEEAERRGGVHVSAIHLKIGPLSGVVKEVLLSAYELAIEQTSFADCCLIIEEIPIVVHCSTCDGERPVRSMQCFCCAECGAPALQVVRGRELQVSALELAG
ncbi:MAG: hydrogenase maturation nickel metallochaperone HypA [Bryobacteraceae bacterium]